MSRTIGFLYDSYAQAAHAVSDLEAAGISGADIGFVANNSASGEACVNTATITAGQSAETGATVGAAVGGGAGLLAGLGLLAIPGLGPVVAAGWLATTVMGAAAGAGAGAAAGGILGMLTNAGITETDAHLYAESVRRGSTLVTVRCDDGRIGAVEQIMRQHNPVDPDDRRRNYRDTGWAAFDESTPPIRTTGPT
jgi:hypothetical protein